MDGVEMTDAEHSGMTTNQAMHLHCIACMI
jgi:hypothetical protein